LQILSCGANLKNQRFPRGRARGAVHLSHWVLERGFWEKEKERRSEWLHYCTTICTLSEVNCGHKLKVQIAIKYLILGIFRIYNLQ